MITALELLLIFALDAFAGDPRWIPHPVRWIGTAILKLEAWARDMFDSRKGGILLTVIIVAGTWYISYLAVWFARAPESWFLRMVGIAIIVYLGWSTLALRGLLTSVKSVFDAPSLEDARERLSGIVGRDTAEMDEQSVRRAAIESLAENASDGVVAPLFYMAIGGVPLALAYKAVNTLDSMIGYRNERYIEFGRFAAKLDDIANYIPARLTGYFIVLAVYFLDRPKARTAREIMKRDGSAHTSPNSGIPEAALAGALGVRLGGPSRYGGELVEKPWINGEGDEVSGGVQASALVITTVACLFALVFSIMVIVLCP